MLKVKTTPNLYGVTLMGDYEDLDQLYDSISRYLSFYNDNAEWYPYHEYEYMLSLNYDIRHCYQGDRGFETVDNCADRFEEWASPEFGLPVEYRKEYKKLYNKFKNGNLYYTVEILYPLIFHYLVSFEMILEEEPRDSWFETETEFGGKWRETYSMIDAMKDRAAINHLVSLFWDNIQELFGREKADTVYYYLLSKEYTIVSYVYCDALIHCQLVNFGDMSRKEKISYLLACFYEIIDIEALETYPQDFEEDVKLYHDAIKALNSGGITRFPVKSVFYDEMDKIYDPTKPMYRDTFDQFLNDTYGEDPDPYETGEFEW